MAGQPNLFDLDERYRALSVAGDPLERLAKVVDFELFRVELKAALQRSDRSRGGRPPCNPVLMFRVPVLRCCRPCTLCRTTRPSTSCATGSRSCRCGDFLERHGITLKKDDACGRARPPGCRAHRDRGCRCEAPPSGQL
jgi:hypothetical protein